MQLDLTFKKKNITFNHKPIQICSTKSFHDKYGGLETFVYISQVSKALLKRPVDMYVFSTANSKMTIRCAGYVLPEQTELDEETIITKLDSLNTETFWFKLDDYGDKYVGMFLFPHEY